MYMYMLTGVHVGPQTRTPPRTRREQRSTVRERLLSVRERVFSTVRSRTAFTRARTDYHLCAHGYFSQMGVCHLNIRSFVNPAKGK